MQRGTASGEEILCVPLHLAPAAHAGGENAAFGDTHTTP